MYTRCGFPPLAVAASTRLLVASASPLLSLAQCTIAQTPSTAGWMPVPATRSPVTTSTPSAAARDRGPRRLSTRTSRPASPSCWTTSRPSVPVPPVTKIGEVVAPPRVVIRRLYDGRQPAAVTRGRVDRLSGYAVHYLSN